MRSCTSSRTSKIEIIGSTRTKRNRQRQEETDRPEQCCPIPNRRPIHVPGGRKKIAMQAGDDDHEALQPHPHVDHHGHNPEQRQHYFERGMTRATAESRCCMRSAPIERPVGSGHAVLHHELFECIGAVPRHEGLHGVSIGDDQSGGEHHFRHRLQVPRRDEVLKMVIPAERNHRARAPSRSRNRSRLRRNRAERSSCAIRAGLRSPKSKLTTV